MSVTSMGTVIATRELALAGGGAVVVTIGKPERFPDDSAFYCPYQITGLGTQSVMSACGEDAIQALLLALEMIGAFLYTSPEAQSGALSWDCAPTAGDLGFPVPDSIRHLAPPSESLGRHDRVGHCDKVKFLCRADPVTSLSHGGKRDCRRKVLAFGYSLFMAIVLLVIQWTVSCLSGDCF